jgi:hypothetical protein
VITNIITYYLHYFSSCGNPIFCISGVYLSNCNQNQGMWKENFLDGFILEPVMLNTFLFHTRFFFIFLHIEAYS